MTSYAIYIFTISALIGGCYSLLARSTLKTVIALLAIAFCVSMILFLLGSTFMGISYIIIYISVVLLLLAFGLMLEGKNFLTPTPAYKKRAKSAMRHIGAFIASAFLFAVMARMVINIIKTRHFSIPKNEIDIQQIAMALFFKQVIPFELISLILLAVIIGIIGINKIQQE